MAAADNQRIYFAIQKVGFKGDGEAGNYEAAHGVQDISIATNFNIDPVFQLGQLESYELVEDIPDVEITMSKLLDGYIPIYIYATQQATSPTLSGRSSVKCVMGMGIYDEDRATEAHDPDAVVECSGLYVQSVSFEFPVDGNFTENITLVGNDKIWKDDANIVNPDNSARAAVLPSPGALWTSEVPVGTGGVQRRQDLQFAFVTGFGLDTNNMVADPDATVLPPDIYGITASGSNESSVFGAYDVHVQNITVSAEFGRTPINELGRRSPYYRYVEFPVEVTCDIEVIATSGDFISATEAGILTTTGQNVCGDVGNLTNRTIRIATCEGTRISLGIKNKLNSVQYGNGGVGGGNATVTYSYTNFNDLTVIHPLEETINATALSEDWWSDRSSYLVS